MSNPIERRPIIKKVPRRRASYEVIVPQALNVLIVLLLINGEQVTRSRSVCTSQVVSLVRLECATGLTTLGQVTINRRGYEIDVAHITSSFLTHRDCQTKVEREVKWFAGRGKC